MVNKRSLDWSYLGENMLIPMATLGIAIALLVFGDWYQSVHEDRYAQYSVSQKNIHNDYDALIARKRTLERYHQRYDQFRTTGFVGREDRLDWVETIRTTATDLALPYVTYSIEPQAPVIPPRTATQVDADVQVRASKVELDIGLVHELDLLRFFNQLQTEAPGLMKVDECSMMRQNSSEESRANEANIVAICKLLVFSVVTSDIPVSETG